MKYGSVNVNLRPLKLAFVIDPTDKESFLTAVKINTFLWGGTYNPIIPYFSKKPRVILNDFELKRASNKTILNGYLENFDPDFVVPMGKVRNIKLDFGDREVIEESEILQGVRDEGIPRFGVGLYEILQHFGHEELRFVRRQPLEIILPSIGRQYKPFLASIFGYLPDYVEESLNKKGWRETLGYKRIKCTVSNYPYYIKSKILFPRRISSSYFEKTSPNSSLFGDCIYLTDATSLLDTIDYWNLRAIGWNILPIAKQAYTSKGLLKRAKKFIESNFHPLRHNPQIYTSTTILKSRNTSVEELHNFVKALDIKPTEKTKETKFVLDMSYPRVWKRWAWDKDGVESCSLQADSKRVDLPKSDNQINIKTLDPKFVSKYDATGQPRFVNEIDIHFYGGSESLAEVLPEGGKNTIRAIESVGYREVRFSRKGIAFLLHYTNWNITFKLPEAEELFREWLIDSGWQKIELSPPGKIAKQLINHLGGVGRISILSTRGIVSLLGKMAGNNRALSEVKGEVVKLEKLVSSSKHKGLDKKLERLGKILDEKTDNLESANKSLSFDKLKEEVGKISSQQKRRFPISPEGVLHRLIESGVFNFGVELVCPVCSKKSWYSLEEASKKPKCPRCLKKFDLPVQTPKKDIKWSYQISSPFSEPGLAQGAYSVLLTLHFFSALLSASTTPILSFNAVKDGKELESDLGILFKKSRFSETDEIIPIFAECKSLNNRFKKRDIERMVFIGEEFQGSVLVFATLRESLTPKEKQLITPLVQKYRKNWMKGKPRNQILILTATELFSDEDFPTSWELSGKKYEKFAKNGRWVDLNTLCDTTQQLYLDAIPFWDWYDKNKKH